MRFDATISLGNILTVSALVFAGIWAWRDMTWRVSNLESWRKEHMVDADARDKLITTMGKILEHVKWQTDFMYGRQMGRKLGPPPSAED